MTGVILYLLWIIIFIVVVIRKPIKLGVLLGTMHLVLSIVIVISDYPFDPTTAESSAPAALLFIIDFPLSLISNQLLLFIGDKFHFDIYYIAVVTLVILGPVYYFFIGIGIGLIYKKLKKEPSKVLTKTGNETEWSVTPKIAPPLPSKTSGYLVKHIKWISISIAILVILSIIVIIHTYEGRHSILYNNFNVALFSVFLFPLFPLLIVLIGYFLIYPKFQYDFWIQRFLGGIILFSFHLLAAYFAIWFLFRSLLRLFDLDSPLSVKPAYILVYILAYILFISPFIVMIFLCFLLQKKTKSLTERTKKIYKNILLFPLGVSILNSLLFLVPTTYIKLLNVSFFPLLALTIGIPAVINGYQMPKKLLFLSYVGIGVAHLFLITGGYMLLGWFFSECINL